MPVSSSRRSARPAGGGRTAAVSARSSTTGSRTGKRRGPWNSGVEVGPRKAFTPAEVGRIRAALTKLGDKGMRDLAAFNTAIDTMLHAADLLALTVKDVRGRDGGIRDVIDIAPSSRTGLAVRCTLSRETRRILERWIEGSDKKPRDALFTGRTRSQDRALTPRQLSRLVKQWAEMIGLDAETYGTESLRRTRAVHIMSETGNLEAVRLLLGHADIGSTARYLGEYRKQDALAVSRRCEI